MHARKLIVIIAEGALEKILVKEILAAGAHGYTISDVRGGGRHGPREAAWEADRNIRIEVVCDDAVAIAITSMLQNKFMENYATTLYVADIDVLRPEKF